MFSKQNLGRALLAVSILSVCGGLVAQAQNAAAPAAGQARAAVEERRAVYKLIGANFRPLGALLKEDGKYDATEVTKRIDREVFLSGLTPEIFPDYSNVGEPDSKAKPEIWSKRADFDLAQKKLIVDLAALKTVNDRDQKLSEAFKTALGTVAQDCKACHDDFKLK
jgi:cytochrome c556